MRGQRKLMNPTKSVICDVYLQGKMTRTLFPKVSNRESDLLDLVHTNVRGKIPKMQGRGVQGEDRLSRPRGKPKGEDREVHSVRQRSLVHEP